MSTPAASSWGCAGATTPYYHHRSHCDDSEHVCFAYSPQAPCAGILLASCASAIYFGGVLAQGRQEGRIYLHCEWFERMVYELVRDAASEDTDIHVCTGTCLCVPPNVDNIRTAKQKK